MPVTSADKRATFKKMHESGCFILPNPHDVGRAITEGVTFMQAGVDGLFWDQPDIGVEARKDFHRG